MRVGVVGCGLIGRKRAAALGADDELVGCFDVAARGRAARSPPSTAGRRWTALEALLALAPDVVVVATTHDRLAELSIAALDGRRARARREARRDRPRAGRGRRRRRGARGPAGQGRLQPSLPSRHRAGGRGGPLRRARRAPARARPLRPRRPARATRREWRADPARSGGGELIDQGMHLLDLSHWLLGPLPLHSALLRTRVLGHAGRGQRGRRCSASATTGPWALMHVSWTEWKNLFSLEIYCRTAKLAGRRPRALLRRRSG